MDKLETDFKSDDGARKINERMALLNIETGNPFA
jgi:hypothetical protein